VARPKRAAEHGVVEPRGQLVGSLIVGGTKNEAIAVDCSSSTTQRVFRRLKALAR
jgi:hypothetical protein